MFKIISRRHLNHIYASKFERSLLNENEKQRLDYEQNSLGSTIPLALKLK